MTPELPPHVSASYGIAPWERQAREGEKEWAQFRLYRDSGYPNSTSEPFQARDLKQLSLVTGVRLGEIKAAHATYSWDERAGAYDREIDRRKTAAGMTSMERAELQHARIRDKQRMIIEMATDAQLARSESGEHLTAREIATWTEMLNKNDRLANGQSTENVSVKHGFDLELSTPEELEALVAYQAELTARKGQG